MYLYEVGEPDNREELRKMENTLEDLFPEVNWPQSINWGMGCIWGEKKGHSEFPVLLFNRLGLAYFHETFDEVSTRKKLESVGYEVPRKPFESKEEVDALLWEDIQKRRPQYIRAHLLRHLQPIIEAVPDAKAIELVEYDPLVAGCSDMPRLDHFKWNRTFPLEISDGEIDLDYLFKEACSISPYHALGLSSRLNGNKDMQMPLIDFAGGTYVEDAILTCDRLGMPTTQTADSGNSFHHFFLKGRMTFKDYLRYLEKIKNFTEIGESWPFYSSVQEFAFLRILPSASKPHWPEHLTKEDIDWVRRNSSDPSLSSELFHHFEPVS